MPQKRRATFRWPYHNALISLRKFGAGEGIRTLDPNLGKTREPLLSSLIRPDETHFPHIFLIFIYARVYHAPPRFSFSCLPSAYPHAMMVFG